jgi:hypothetical protein
VVPSLVDVSAGPAPHHDSLADAVDAQLDGRPDEPIVFAVHSGAGSLVPSIVDAVGRHGRGPLWTGDQ